MKHILSLILTFTLAFFSYTAQSEESQLAGLSAWQNQYGSTFTINTISPTGELTGSYVNRAPNTGCQNIAYDAVGYVYANLISWSVNWNNAQANCMSITGWTGFYANGAITTDWNLVYNNQIQQGKDVFKQIAAKSFKGLVTK